MAGAAAAAVALADDLALLTRRPRSDGRAVSGRPSAGRGAVFDWSGSAVQARGPRYPRQLRPLARLLQNHRARWLAFAAQLDQDLAAVATPFAVPRDVVGAVLGRHGGNPRRVHHGQQEAALRQKRDARFYPLQQAGREGADRTARAGSIIENLNSRLRTYCTSRRAIGADYLVLLQFFLNQRRFPRSERPRRVGQSPAELRTGQAPPWREMLGDTRFSQN